MRWCETVPGVFTECQRIAVTYRIIIKKRTKDESENEKRNHRVKKTNGRRGH